MYMNFRNGKGSHYGANGDWKSSRTKPPGQALKEGDHFTVQFENVDVHKSPYCAPNPTCENDGFQFHMTSLKENGIMKAPYDPDESNTYRITDQSGDLNHYHVRVTRSGNGAKDAKVELWGYGGDTKHSKGTQHTTNFDAGHDFEVHGFPKSLFIKPKDNKLDGELDFRYHEKNQPINHDKYAYFEWTTNSKGRYSSTASNKYCEGKSSGQGAQAKHVWDCRFPGY
ncbi:uncharacterized protein K452DRAFT_159100 [Aplosporella prunicola CBS 121167]|uniref:Uncharacterized protein n=1 Tax=Aplosporella prunicola CBS 121167 TaxID=1176127 RepID=A0A6A6BHA4_9PEZI|nr:uncharacterized protein K452DRAFT_159100 [Aplosporella prunicola CBS 121167]KAF2143529.1 hypothetical protein K452DRAFT_159100 [Aplosporella prunicola CBS 121167]